MVLGVVATCPFPRVGPVFLTKAMWAPYGINLAWLTTMPLVALLASPITELLGPIASYNILCLLSLPLSAWCAFIACRYLTKDYWSSLLGGYIFGFSPFMLSHLAYGHLIVLFAFPIPLTVYLVALQFAGEVAERKFVLLLTLLLVAEFLTSLEILALRHDDYLWRACFVVRVASEPQQSAAANFSSNQTYRPQLRRHSALGQPLPVLLCRF